MFMSVSVCANFKKKMRQKASLSGQAKDIDQVVKKNHFSYKSHTEKINNYRDIFLFEIPCVTVEKRSRMQTCSALLVVMHRRIQVSPRQVSEYLQGIIKLRNPLRAGLRSCAADILSDMGNREKKLNFKRFRYGADYQ